MRNFAYKNPDYIKNEVVPELIEDNPCYQQSVYDTVMYDESPDGDLIQCDMTQISYMVGINDPRYFSKCFKAQVGMTPTEYKEKIGR